jgi:hypothetical protein
MLGRPWHVNAMFKECHLTGTSRQRTVLCRRCCLGPGSESRRPPTSGAKQDRAAPGSEHISLWLGS